MEVRGHGSAIGRTAAPSDVRKSRIGSANVADPVFARFEPVVAATVCGMKLHSVALARGGRFPEGQVLKAADRLS